MPIKITTLRQTIKKKMIAVSDCISWLHLLKTTFLCVQLYKLYGFESNGTYSKDSRRNSYQHTFCVEILYVDIREE